MTTRMMRNKTKRGDSLNGQLLLPLASLFFFSLSVSSCIKLSIHSYSTQSCARFFSSRKNVRWWVCLSSNISPKNGSTRSQIPVSSCFGGGGGGTSFFCFSSSSCCIRSGWVLLVSLEFCCHFLIFFRARITGSHSDPASWYLITFDTFFPFSALCLCMRKNSSNRCSAVLFCQEKKLCTHKKTSWCPRSLWILLWNKSSNKTATFHRKKTLRHIRNLFAVALEDVINARTPFMSRLTFTHLDFFSTSGVTGPRGFALWQ